MNICEVTNITKSLNKVPIIKDISFTLQKGEIVGLVGPNGAGKSTTMKMMTGFLFPDEGDIKINGYSIRKERELALSQCTSIIETPPLYPNLTGKHHLNFIGNVRNISKEKLKSIEDFIDIGKSIDKNTGTYSLGMKQRLALGMAMLTEPCLLILDEPTNGLDPSGIMELRETLIKLAIEKQITIFISSHNLEEIEKICNRIIFIKDGIINKVFDNKQKEKQENYSMTVSDASKLEHLVSNLDFVLDWKSNNDFWVLSIKRGYLTQLIQETINHNIDVSDLCVFSNSIENQYQEMIEGGEK